MQSKAGRGGTRGGGSSQCSSRLKSRAGNGNARHAKSRRRGAFGHGGFYGLLGGDEDFKAAAELPGQVAVRLAPPDRRLLKGEEVRAVGVHGGAGELIEGGRARVPGAERKIHRY